VDISDTVEQAADTATELVSRSKQALSDALRLDEVDERAQLQKVLASFDTAMLITNLQDVPSGRPMRVLAREDGAVWFVSGNQSPKVLEIADDGTALITLQSPRAYAVVRGQATLEHDPERLASWWNPVVDAWFPEGPASKDAVLIRFTPTSGQYWDLTGTRGLRFAAHIVEAIATGESVRPVPGVEGETAL